MIEDDSLVDFDNQIEEIHDLENSNLNFDEPNNDDVNAESFEQPTPLNDKDPTAFQKMLKPDSHREKIEKLDEDDSDSDEEMPKGRSTTNGKVILLIQNS